MRQKNRDKISIVDKIENSNDKFGWAVLGIYIAALAVISYFHEPWFDEAQSWLISRDLPIKDIIFYMPHYEGHPPLWHLYLAVFSKLNFPYELGLNLAAIFLNALAMGLLIFKAPFKKIIRYTIPFTYYFFYLYGVINRCYSFTMLGFVLLALTYKNRNSQPFKYILSMMLICASTAYGIVLCGGLSIVWLIEIISENGIKDFAKRFIKDKRIASLLSLLIFALFIIYLIMPNSDTYAANLANYEASILQRTFYMFILAPLDATFFTSALGNYMIMYADIRPNVYVLGTVLFLLLSTFFFFIGKKRELLRTIILPYALFALFASNIYFSEHHIAVITYFFMFWLWICFDIKQGIHIPEHLQGLKPLIKIFTAALILINLFWSVSASLIEINTNFSSAKEITEFIDEYDLSDEQILIQWKTPVNSSAVDYPNIYDQVCPAMLAYYDENIFYGFNNGDKSITYNTHIKPTEAQVETEYNRLKSLGAPAVLIGHPDLEGVFDGDVTLKDYTLVKIITEKRIVKADFWRVDDVLRIYVRNDLVDKYGFEEIDESYVIGILKGEIKHK